MTTLYCENCKEYLYIPAAEFFYSDFRKHLEKDGFSFREPKSCDGLVIKLEGCGICGSKRKGMILFRAERVVL